LPRVAGLAASPGQRMLIPSPQGAPSAQLPFWNYPANDISHPFTLTHYYNSLTHPIHSTWYPTGTPGGGAGGATEDDGGTTIFLKGFDRYLGEDEVRNQLTAAFAEYGAVQNIRLPTDRETGELKGFGYIEFASQEEKVSRVMSSLIGQYLARGASVVIGFSTVGCDRTCFALGASCDRFSRPCCH
jgi:RNA recognition motif. (a.k.a. RRM, RBD, or RNP domain)